MGIGVATSVRIGTLLGSQSPAQAKRSANMAVLLATIVGGVVLLLLLVFRRTFGRLFSDDEAVVDLVAAVLPFVAAFQIADGWAQSCGGVLRGLGRQALGASVNLLAYYVLALPFGVL